MLNGFTLNPHSFVYPSLFYYLSLIFSLPVFIIFGEDWKLLLIIQRCVSLTFGLLTIGLTYKISEKIYNRKVAILSSFLLAVSPFHIEMSITAKPDMTQLGFVMLSLFYCINFIYNNGNKNCYLGLIFAGFAFSTKLFGILLIPIWIYAYMINISNKMRINSFEDFKLFFQNALTAKVKTYKLLLCLISFS